MAKSKAQLAAEVRAGHETWRQLVAAVPPDRMDEPGPMGEWSFRDMVSHLDAWRLRALKRLEAAARSEPEPPDPWPAHLDDDDAINDWIRERDRTRPLDAMLADYDGTFERLVGAIEALPDAVFAEPAAGASIGDQAITDVAPNEHLDEHASAARAWIERTAAP